ncbi:MAG: 50S ribosomal protein L27 [Patescibacteria group bacterium]|jgi:large subunit ribosomal protein L27
MAHKKAAGVSRLGRDSESKRLGVKLGDGQKAIPGNIIIRQRGTRYYAGKNVRMGVDHTLYSVALGVVKFSSKMMKKFNDRIVKVKVVNVVAVEKKETKPATEKVKTAETATKK